MLGDEFYKGHDDDINALARLIAIQTHEEEDLVGNIHDLSGLGLCHKRKDGGIVAVKKDINGPRDVPLLKNITPFLGEGEEAVRLLLADLDVLLELALVDLI
jgi:hypothetical protein